MFQTRKLQIIIRMALVLPCTSKIRLQLITREILVWLSACVVAECNQRDSACIELHLMSDVTVGWFIHKCSPFSSPKSRWRNDSGCMKLIVWLQNIMMCWSAVSVPILAFPLVSMVGSYCAPLLVYLLQPFRRDIRETSRCASHSYIKELIGKSMRLNWGLLSWQFVLGFQGLALHVLLKPLHWNGSSSSDGGWAL